MEVVSIMFYWGGKILSNRDEGVSYDIEPQGLYNVYRGITLSELEAMMVPKVGTHGEIMRLQFKCRLPCRGQYRLLPIKDNETLSNVLDLPHKLGPDYFLEIYVEKESNFGSTGMPFPVGGTFTQMLTQLQSPDNTLTRSADMFPADYPLFNHSQSYNELNASQNVDGYYSAGAGPSAPTTYNPMVLTTPYPHWNEECPPVCNVQRTPETAVQNYAYSDDTVPLSDEVGVSDEDSVEDLDVAWEGADNDSGDDEVGGHHDMQEVHTNVHIPFYHNLHLDNDGSITSRDVVERWPLWDFETAHLEKGMIFTDKKRLVHAVQLYNLKRNRECRVVESKGNSWVAECKHGCNWRVRATKLKDKDFFQIRRFEAPHQCVYPRMNRDNCNLKSEVIAHFIKAQIAISPELPLATIIEVVKEKFQFTISYKKAWLARTKAVAMVFGDWDESYRRLPRYMAALQSFNPGTVVMWDMIPNLHSTSIGTEMYMNYVFWAFKPAIEGFKYCRPVICIDGTHLYGKYEGKIVAATAVTAADKIIPLAFAVVDKEMIESWGWFITLLRRHVCRDREGVTLISDRHTALLSVLSRIWDNPAVQPRGYHRYCLRHVCSNFNEKFGNTVAKDLVWRAGSARQVRKFNKIMDDIYKLEKNAERWFRRMNPIHWTLCHDGGCRWGILTTNHIEGFNGVLKGARSVPITASVEITFYRLVKYFDEGRTIAENASNRGHLYTTNVQRWIDEHQAKANVHMLVPINRGIGEYEVRTAPHGMGGGARQISTITIIICLFIL
ncbi:unnamed protein product [Camellia sinensis]